MRFDATKGRREGIEAPAELEDARRRDPARQLTTDIGGVDVADEEKARLEKGQLSDRGEKLAEAHGGSMP